MGTSKAYDAPPSWGPLKNKVVRMCGAPVTRIKATSLVSEFVHRNGGSAAVARGAGAVAGGGAARSVARAFGGLVSDVGRFGLTEALRRAGLAHLAGRSVQEILAGMLDYCGGHGSTLDEVDAREALSRLQDELLSQAATPGDVEALLQQFANPEQLRDLLERFFAFYIYEAFCRVFYERLVQRHGQAQADAAMNDILDFIRATVENRLVDVSVEGIDWSGREGERVVTEIMQQTFDIYGEQP